ncbi:MAG: CHRD domain-containing protein [Candidatus Bipolaricaulota bacterium]|nr:CHRD domain-containing protein [Candidatus Bipolaricaulota bacterium]MDW8030913.1 CHRD domain-containing protein [Candidatus Bipolaricaulota bacterium]
MRRRTLSIAGIGLFAVIAAVYVLGQYGPPDPPSQPPPPRPAASADSVVFTATMTTTQEVPAPTVNTRVIGAGVFFFDPATNTLSFTIAYRGLSGGATAIHFHNGAPGVAGPVVQTICGAPAPALLGACPAGISGVLTGTWTVPAPLVPTLLAGGLYVNIHTAANPPGEIRGQINPL